MVTPYRQIHELNNGATMPLTIDISEELAQEDLSDWIHPDGGLTGAAQDHLAEEDRNGGFV
tara:strand:- start:11741 stop:11923 length:183 start_codon:yes stop_codon:yes gene_type:complete